MFLKYALSSDIAMCSGLGKFVLINTTLFLLPGKEVLTANRLGNVECLTFDWISRNLYWTDGGLKSVSVMRLADKSRRQIISDLNTPRSIVVHPTAGYVRTRNGYICLHGVLPRGSDHIPHLQFHPFGTHFSDHLISFKNVKFL